MSVTALELRRRSDALIYRFVRIDGPEGAVFRREDAPLDLVWRAGFGWGAWEGAVLQGRPWHVPVSKQNRIAPPEGLWVSQKGDRSYSYDLVHVAFATGPATSGPDRATGN